MITYHRIVLSFFDWALRGFRPPLPVLAKWRTLMAFAPTEAEWIETGTYRAHTTAFLARRFRHVISIEPSENLHGKASRNLRSYTNVDLLLGTSEEVLAQALSLVSGDVCLWLDGHFSDGSTYSGEKVTPILDELELVQEAWDRFESATVFIDDFRLFRHTFGGDAHYPEANTLVEWANRNEASWTVENDIFIAKKTASI